MLHYVIISRVAARDLQITSRHLKKFIVGSPRPSTKGNKKKTVARRSSEGPKRVDVVRFINL